MVSRYGDSPLRIVLIIGIVVHCYVSRLYWFMYSLTVICSPVNKKMSVNEIPGIFINE